MNDPVQFEKSTPNIGQALADLEFRLAAVTTQNRLEPELYEALSAAKAFGGGLERSSSKTLPEVVHLFPDNHVHVLAVRSCGRRLRQALRQMESELRASIRGASVPELQKAIARFRQVWSLWIGIMGFSFL